MRHDFMIIFIQTTSAKKEMTAIKTPSAPKSNWEEQKDKLKLNFPKLTDEDLNFDESNKFEMLTQLQVKVGRTTKELQVIIETL